MLDTTSETIATSQKCAQHSCFERVFYLIRSFNFVSFFFFKVMHNKWPWQIFGENSYHPKILNLIFRKSFSFRNIYLTKCWKRETERLMIFTYIRLEMFHVSVSNQMWWKARKLSIDWQAGKRRKYCVYNYYTGREIIFYLMARQVLISFHTPDMKHKLPSTDIVSH